MCDTQLFKYADALDSFACAHAYTGDTLDLIPRYGLYLHLHLNALPRNGASSQGRKKRLKQRQ